MVVAYAYSIFDLISPSKFRDEVKIVRLTCL